jgi:predicted cupin superfamily sugar epimerase
MSDTIRELIQRLGLEPHPEGGHYREVFRSTRTVTRDGVARSAVTTIHFLLARGQASRWHVVESDEVWCFHQGDDLELITYDPVSLRLQTVRLGAQTRASTRVHVVPAGEWQAARPSGEYSLTGCTVAPGFEFDDFAFVADLPGHEAAFDGPLSAFRDLL